MKRVLALCLVTLALVSSCAKKTIQETQETEDGWPNPSPKLQAEFLQRAFPGGARDILNNSNRFNLLSLDSLGDVKGKPSFHGYGVLGKTSIKNGERKAALLKAFYEDVAKSAHTPGGTSPAKTCFFPRHGIQSVQGDKFVDLVICFECSQFRLYTNGKEEGSTVLGISAELFNRTLKQAGVHIPSK